MSSFNALQLSAVAQFEIELNLCGQGGEIALAAVIDNRVTWTHKTRSIEGTQLDDSIGDTLVSVYAVGSHLETLSSCEFVAWKGQIWRNLT
jgi:hypothetical protein